MFLKEAFESSLKRSARHVRSSCRSHFVDIPWHSAPRSYIVAGSFRYAHETVIPLFRITRNDSLSRAPCWCVHCFCSDCGDIVATKYWCIFDIFWITFLFSPFFLHSLSYPTNFSEAAYTRLLHHFLFEIWCKVLSTSICVVRKGEGVKVCEHAYRVTWIGEMQACETFEQRTRNRALAHSRTRALAHSRIRAFAHSRRCALAHSRTRARMVCLVSSAARIWWGKYWWIAIEGTKQCATWHVQLFISVWNRTVTLTVR